MCKSELGPQPGVGTSKAGPQPETLYQSESPSWLVNRPGGRGPIHDPSPPRGFLLLFTAADPPSVRASRRSMQVVCQYKVACQCKSSGKVKSSGGANGCAGDYADLKRAWKCRAPAQRSLLAFSARANPQDRNRTANNRKSGASGVAAFH